jgi:hypothetical protein
MHVVRPLPGNDRAFDRLQQADAERESQWQPNENMQPIWRRKCDLHGERGGHDNVSGDENNEVCGRVVGAVMVKNFAAHGALVHRFEEGPKQPSLAAVWTAAVQAP